MTSMFKTLYKPPPSMSSRNCSKIWLECPMKSERMGERKGGGGHSHTPTEWWILFGLCLPSLNLAVSVCYVGFYGEKHGTCQTLSPTRNNEKNVCRDEERGGNVVMVKGRGGGGAIPRIQRVWNHRARHNTRRYICSWLKQWSQDGAAKRFDRGSIMQTVSCLERLLLSFSWRTPVFTLFHACLYTRLLSIVCDIIEMVRLRGESQS